MTKLGREFENFKLDSLEHKSGAEGNLWNGPQIAKNWTMKKIL
jgi:hypothetical protein